LPDDGLSAKPKHVASNKTAMHLVVVDCTSTFTVHISERDVTDYDVSYVGVSYLFRVRRCDVVF